MDSSMDSSANVQWINGAFVPVLVCAGSGNPMFGNSDTLDARASAAKLNTLVSQSISQDSQRYASNTVIGRTPKPLSIIF